MQIINYINVKDGRCLGVEFVYTDKVEQIESHGMSYLDMRNWIKLTGDLMGLDVTTQSAGAKGLAKTILDSEREQSNSGSEFSFKHKKQNNKKRNY